MRSAIRLAGTLLVLTAIAPTVEARRLPRQSFRPVVGLTDARVDLQFHTGTMPPSRDEQLLPLPSFAAPPGYRGLHGSIWQAVRHYDWTQQQRALAAAREEAVSAPASGTILILSRSRSADRPTTRPSANANASPIISVVRILPGLDG